MNNIPQEDQRDFGNTCIEAARNILRILNDLLKYGQLGQWLLSMSPSRLPLHNNSTPEC